MSEYDANAIQVLRWPEAVRKRPAMYIGDTSTSEGLETMIFCLVDDVVAQFRAYEATELGVEIGPDRWVSVRDDGLGMPPENIEAFFTTPFMRPPWQEGTLWPRGGVHGMDMAIVTAFSERLEVELSYRGVRWAQAFERGEPTSRVRRLGQTSLHGMQVRFRPDPMIFSSVEVAPRAIEWRLRELAWCLPHLRVFLQERRLDGRGGLAGLARDLSQGTSGTVQAMHVIERCENAMRIEVALAWSDEERGQPRICSFANGYGTPRHGTHVEGIWHALVSYARQAGAAARTHSAVREVLGHGFAAAIHVEDPAAQYDSVARDRLCTKNIARAVRAAIFDSLLALPSCSRLRKCVDARLGISARKNEE